MKNGFYTHPIEDIIVDIEHMYKIHDSIIYVDAENVHMVISEAENVIALLGKGVGNKRISNAIEDAVLQTCDVAVGYDLFTAEKIIVKISCPIDNTLKLAEMVDVVRFAEMFKSDTNFIFGISEIEGSSSDVLVQIIASNLHKQ